MHILLTGGSAIGEKAAEKHPEEPALLRAEGHVQQSSGISEEAGSSFAGENKILRLSCFVGVENFLCYDRYGNCRANISSVECVCYHFAISLV